MSQTHLRTMRHLHEDPHRAPLLVEDGHGGGHHEALLHQPLCGVPGVMRLEPEQKTSW